MKRIKFLLIFVFANTLIFEIFSLSMCEMFSLCNTPSYSLQNKQKHHWIDHEIYGVWHKENSEFLHVADCFSAKYYFNNFGAKDIDRSQVGKNRTLIVGDSYIEGYGINNDKNFTYLLEKESKNNIKYLNFSTSGYFGSTQYYILIKDLLRKIEFDRVILFLNPSSDFKDDSFEYGKLFHYKKYRPYFDPIQNKIFYYNENNKNSQNDQIKFKDLLNNFTYSYNFLRYLKQQITSRLRSEKINQLNNKNNNGYVSYYEEYPNDIFQILKTNLENINQILSEKDIKLIVFTMPSKKDLIYFKSNPNAENNLDKEMEKYLKKFGVKFFSILQTGGISKKMEIKDYFNCTDHLKENGQIRLKNIIKNQLVSINEQY